MLCLTFAFRMAYSAMELMVDNLSFLFNDALSIEIYSVGDRMIMSMEHSVQVCEGGVRRLLCKSNQEGFTILPPHVSPDQWIPGGITKSNLVDYFFQELHVSCDLVVSAVAPVNIISPNTKKKIEMLD
jgi:hypothetical protein